TLPHAPPPPHSFPTRRSSDLTGSPDPKVSADTFTARWQGCVQPQFNETYTFYTTADDGVRLWINGQQIINGWVDQAPTTYSATRSEEHTSELQSQSNLVCRLL